MRAGPIALAVLVLCGACTGGDGAGVGPASTAPAETSTAPSFTAPSPSATSTSTGVPVTDPAGSVTLRVAGLTLPDIRSGGSGLRLLVRASSSRLTVRREGGGAPVTACPVAGPTAPVNPAECVGLGPDSAVEIGSGGVELRATGADAAVGEVGVTYLPATRSTTVVTPARPPGACAARPCEATFSLLPAGSGAFSLDGQATGGRPRMVLTSVRPTGAPGSNRTLATVEGGGSLSIRATVEVGSEARLLHQEQGADAAFPVTAEILWP